MKEAYTPDERYKGYYLRSRVLVCMEKLQGNCIFRYECGDNLLNGRCTDTIVDFIKAQDEGCRGVIVKDNVIAYETSDPKGVRIIAQGIMYVYKY